MLNVVIAGVGGQGSVLAAKILAQAATEKGWHVRTAETIGMAQRGGNVLSHVRMGNAGEQIHAPLVPKGMADCVIALEPGEGLRALPFLAPEGLLVTAQSGIDSVVANLTGATYNPEHILAHLREAVAHVSVVNDEALCQAVGNRKALNVGMLGAAVRASNELHCGLQNFITLDDLKAALAVCVKPQFVNMNTAALEWQEQ